ncbi:MAG: hypothetical protein JW775_09480, partial [Candidatus Aminicenantes bacterium]|nr:hypothetical protein [Candidatus Aminicenantes bacterium]
ALKQLARLPLTWAIRKTPDSHQDKEIQDRRFTLRASRSGRICFVAKGSQYSEYSFTHWRLASAAASTCE